MVKVKYLILVLLLIGVDVSAQTYADTVRIINQQIRRNLNVDTTSCICGDHITEPMIAEGFIATASAVYGRFIADTIIAVDGDFDYVVKDSIVFITSVQWHKGDSLKALTPLHRNLWTGAHTALRTLRGLAEWLNVPDYYDWEIGYIFVNPAPAVASGTDTFVVHGYGNASDVIGDPTYPQDFRENYRLCAIYYATAMTALSFQRYEEWSGWLKMFEWSVDVLNSRVIRESSEK